MKELEILYEWYSCDNKYPGDRPDTKEAMEEVWEALTGLSEGKADMEDVKGSIARYAAENEQQGFIYGFQLAVCMLVGCLSR